MRISDWSSDVCSSDRQHQVHRPVPYQPTYHSADRQDAGHSADQSGCDHHDEGHHGGEDAPERKDGKTARQVHRSWRSEEHTSELQSLMRISYAVFCLKKKKHKLYTLSSGH